MGEAARCLRRTDVGIGQGREGRREDAPDGAIHSSQEARPGLESLNRKEVRRAAGVTLGDARNRRSQDAGRLNSTTGVCATRWSAMDRLYQLLSEPDYSDPSAPASS